MSAQLPLDFSALRARRNDPATSKAAAKRASDFAAHHWGAIRAALAQGPATFREISERCGVDEHGEPILERHAVARRLPELKRAGIVRITGEVRQNARVWELVP